MGVLVCNLTTHLDGIVVFSGESSSIGGTFALIAMLNARIMTCFK